MTTLGSRLSSISRTGFIGNPHAAPTCEIVEFSFSRCPPSSQIGLAYPFGNLIPLYVPFYNVHTPSGRSIADRLLGPLVAAPIFVRLAGRTDSDYGLDADSSPIYHVLPLPGTESTCGGCRRTPSTTWPGLPAAQGFAACSEFIVCPGVTERRQTSLRFPTSRIPTDCGVPLTAAMDSNITPTTSPRRHAMAGDDRLRPAQLQPEPHCPADDDPGRHRVRLRRQPESPADAERRPLLRRPRSARRR